MSAPRVRRRRERPEDEAFRFALFGLSLPRAQSLEALDAPLREMLLRQQFAGQTMTYRAAYPDAAFDVIEEEGRPIGRIIVAMAAEAITLVDIAILPDWRGRGIGGEMIRCVQREADRPVRLAVRHGERAMALYARLGFAAVEADAIETRMQWDRPRHPDRLRLPFAFDPAPLAAEVAALAAHGWIAHFVTQNYVGEWSVIPLRCKAGATHPVMMIHSDPACRDFVDTPALAACPALRAVLAAFACPLEAVRLMRLGPGSVIKEHADHDLDVARGAIRFHVPITTSADVIFTLNGTRVIMTAGSAWYLRLADRHGVANRGTSDRVHLVIDARVNPWVEAMLAEAHLDTRSVA